LAIWSQTGCNGGWFWMCHQLMVTGFALPPPPEELLLLSFPPQPARSSVAAAPRATLRRVNDLTVVSFLVFEPPRSRQSLLGSAAPGVDALPS
jgi:hypothetical protein